MFRLSYKNSDYYKARRKFAAHAQEIAKRQKVSYPSLLPLSHAEALKLVTEKPKKYSVVYVTDPEDIHADYRYKEIVAKSVSTLMCLFRDIDIGEKGKYPPTYEMVRKVIDWAEQRSDIIVCCYSGISRSSALAFLIAAKRFFTCEKMLEVLDRNKHIPNLFVVQLGAEVLKNPDIFGYALRYREEVFARMA